MSSITTIIFEPKILVVYQGNVITITITNPDATLTYEWKPYNRIYLDDSYVQNYGTSFRLIPYKTQTFIVNGIDSNGSVSALSQITIKAIEKPSYLLDNDLLPNEYYDIIINRNTKELRKKLIENKILSQKIIRFYYNQILTAYRFQWTNKNGTQYKMPWLTYIQVNNDSNEVVISFKDQWKLFQYINTNLQRNGYTKSNFAYLINIVNSIYLEKPQQIYIINS
jgi:hypothetical protein